MLPETKIKRSLARLMAVQAIYSYQMMGDADINALIERIIHVQQLGELTDDESFVQGQPDGSYLRTLVSGVFEESEAIDALITQFLRGDWNIDHMDTLLLAILRTAVFELKTQPDIPVRVTMDEYIEIAHAFYATKEVGFVNAVLDSVANELRADEIDGE